MPIITIENFINAPAKTCFDKARDINLHCSAVSRTKERAISGITAEFINLGESVTFEAVHFGVPQRFTARVTEFVRSHYFGDEMTKRHFQIYETSAKSMKHRPNL